MGCGSSKSVKTELSSKDLQFLANNTKFTSDQIQDLFDGFVKECPDAKLRKPDLIKNYQELYPRGDPSEFCDYLFQTIKEKKKDFATFRNFVLALSELESDLDRQLKYLFKIYDLNKNKSISFEEIKKLVKAVEKLKGLNKNLSDEQFTEILDLKSKDIFKLFGKSPSDKNSSINELEFVNGLKSNKALFNSLYPSD